MVKNLDDDLTLKQLLARADDLAPGLMIRIYFDPSTGYFYIRFADVLPIFLPDTAYHIDVCPADNVSYMIVKFISDSIYKLNKTP